MKKHGWRSLGIVFFLNFLCAAIAMLPYAFGNGGILTLCEDFNAETIPYYYIMNRAVRSGEIFWNWGIDIGSDFIIAFGMRLCSPFNWIAVLVPESWIPYASVWILLLKYAAAGVTAYMYIRRYTKRIETAAIGSMLYAFSGYQLVSLVFNVFDAVIFFPLMLYSLDRLVLEKKRGWFALAVCINACVSFSLFVQSAILCIIYFIIRFWIGDKRAWRYIGVCMLEAVIGVGIAAFVFVPQLLWMLANNRAAVKLTGSASLSFSTLEILNTIRAWLFPAEAMSNGSSLMETDWTSNAGYLPLVGIVLAVVFGNRNRKHWLTRCMIICIVIMFIPGLNNMFTLMGGYHYRRWYYFVTLMASLASCKVIDETDNNTSIWKESALVFSLIIGYALFVGFVSWDGTDTLAIYDENRYHFGITVACVGILVTAVIWRFAKYADRGLLLLAGIFAMAVLLTYNAVGDYQLQSDHGIGEDSSNDPEIMTNELFRTNDVLGDEEIWPNRVAYWNNYYNYAMIDGLPPRMAFHSVVSNSISELYEMLGTPRYSAMSPYGPSGTDELLSVRYFVLNYDLSSSLTKIREMDNGNYTVRLYEDTTALPVGFTYSTYMTRSEFLTYPVEDRAAVMLKTLVVRDEDAHIVADILEHFDPEVYGIPTTEHIRKYKLEHSGEAATGHYKGRSGSFGVIMNVPSDRYAFFSVPYDSSWTATVNSEEAEILNINGLMAVRIPAGESVVEFKYFPKPLILGVCMSVLFIIVFIMYCIVCKHIQGRKVKYA